MQAGPQQRRPTGWRASLTAVAIGLLGAVLIWIIAPYNNIVMANILIANTMLPASVVFFTLILLLAVNPLLGRLHSPCRLSRTQIAIAFGIMLVSCGLGEVLRTIPFSLPRAAIAVSQDQRLADAYRRLAPPPSLFPDTLGYGAATPASDDFVHELEPGRSVPWRAWLAPLLSWSALMGACSLMMVGLALVVLVQWRRNERLAFPLLTLAQAMIESPPPGRSLPPLYARRTFWIGLAAVLLIHLVNGLNVYFPEHVPEIPLAFNVGYLFTEPPLNFVPGYISTNRIYFTFIALAFFMSNRVCLSVWFFAVAYAVYIVIGQAYFPPFHGGAIGDHRTGAMVALTVAVVWLGRAHWARVFRCMISRRPDEQARRDRAAGWMFALGLLTMWLWLLWAGVGPLWSLALVGAGFMLALLITRLVAETGLPMINIYILHVTDLVKLAPFAWLQPAALYFAAVIGVIFGHGGRGLVGPLAVHALGLHDDQHAPRRQSFLAWGFVPILLAGMVVSGPVHIACAYHRTELLRAARQPERPYGATNLNDANRLILEWSGGKMSLPTYNQAGHIAFGALLAGGLQGACLALPKFPLHPVGLLIVQTWVGNQLWFSVLLGWLIKKLAIAYGGSRLYRLAQPLLLGMILADVLATVVWTSVAAALIALGQQFKVVPVLPF